MRAGNYDIYIEQGATFRLSFVWKDSNGSPIDLRGCTARMQLRYIYPEELILTLTSADGDIAIGGVNGTVEMELTPDRTVPLEKNTGRYDLEIEYGEGEVVRLLEGRWYLSREVTR